MATILVTGGIGYIGSHTVVELLNKNHDVIIVDDLSNSSTLVLERIHAITGKTPTFYQIDINDSEKLSTVFKQHRIDAVIHFAAFKAVGESVEKPLEYYRNNVGGTISLLKVMQAYKVYSIVFSSSATVYGDPIRVPIPEDAIYNPMSPYGLSKVIVEQILTDLSKSDTNWKIAILRYFNPVGAHPSGLIGEDPNGIPNNLMPYITQVAVGIREHLNIFGNDYPTPDGTGVRDYIHVVDLGLGHLSALEYLDKHSGLLVVNLGTGCGYSVLDVVHAFEQASGKTIKYQFAPRRAGDVPSYYADPTLAKELLGWATQYSLLDMCADSWRWQSMNPDGLETQL